MEDKVVSDLGGVILQVVRVQQGRKYYDYTVDEFMDAKFFNPKGDFFDENIVNNSHIPIQSPYED